MRTTILDTTTDLLLDLEKLQKENRILRLEVAAMDKRLRVLERALCFTVTPEDAITEEQEFAIDLKRAFTRE